MDREEILRRNKQTQQDEGEKFIEDRSRRMGEIGLGIFLFCYGSIKLGKACPGKTCWRFFGAI
ncbi:MAG: DUF6442 family protein [Pygmaiobacter massiliensis]|nr:DUF6442 family protein [Pygmaiobacter massiliensis]